MGPWFETRSDRRNQPMTFTDHGWQIAVRHELAMDFCGVSPFRENTAGRGVLRAEAFKKLLEVRAATHPHEFLYPEEFLPEDERTYHAV